MGRGINTTGKVKPKKAKKKTTPKAKGTGHLRHRDDGSWEGQYYVDGKRKSIYNADYNTLRKQLSQINLDIMNKTYVEESEMSLQEWLNHWLEHYSKPVTRHSTYISYETYITKHVIPEIGNLKLRNITPAVLQRMFNDKAISGRLDSKGGLSVKTLRNLRNMLNLTFKQAINSGLVGKNPVRGIKLPHQVKREMRVLTEQEQEALEQSINASTEILAKGILVALYTGVRIGELLALKWSEIDLPEGTMRIAYSLRRQSKEHLSDGSELVCDNEANKTAIMRGRVKTQNSNRLVYLPDKASQAFKELWDWLQEKRTECGKHFNRNNFVFFTESGNPLDARYFQDVFKRHVRKAKIVAANFHCLRHTFATRALERNADLNTVASILGHAQPSTTLNMYGHSMDDSKRKVMKMFNN